MRLKFLSGIAFVLAVQLSFANGYFVDLYPKSKQDVQTILDTLEATISDDRTDEPPIVMMLHGKEAARFLRSGYANNKILVDQTAKLAAYNVLDVRICETWMRINKHSSDDLFPFISTVPYGAAELERLSDEEDYSEFDVDL